MRQTIMLYSLDRLKLVTTVPHQSEFVIWTSRLSAGEMKAIKDELNHRIHGSEVQTSSWIPGSDWTGTAFQPIYEKACQKNVDAAAKCFGLILWQVMMEHPKKWSFGRYKLQNIPIEGLTYFRIDQAP